MCPFFATLNFRRSEKPMFITRSLGLRAERVTKVGEEGASTRQLLQ